MKTNLSDAPPELATDGVLPTTSCSAGGRCRKTYSDECGTRWGGDALRNARGNWTLLEERHDDIVAVLQPYLRDSGVRDIAGNYLNPDHTLTSWLWKCSEAKENWWIWDFCDHYQKCHLRRGLIIYCKMVIAELKVAADSTPGHPEIKLDFETSAYTPPRYVCGVCKGNPCTCARKMSLPNERGLATAPPTPTAE